MKPWWQVVVPHKDIRDGRFDEAVFAADLGDVVNKSGPVDYLDPEVFFDKTYLTAGLKGLIKNVLFRLSGKSGTDSVIQLQTPFGGGKTHTLVALYHLLKNKERVFHLKQVRNFVEKECKLKEVPKAKVVVFVGTQKDILKGKTPWGEIADQLGEYKILEEIDKKRVAPGKENLRKILEKHSPVLILIDEFLEYAVKAAGAKVGEGTLKGQLLAFLQELTETVASLKNCALVITIPSSIRERYDEAAEEVLLQLQKISGRIEAVYTPVEGEEIYEIIRKRLFEDLGKKEDHNITAGKYFEIYQSIGEDIPSFAKEAQYREKIKKAYPFHPEIIDILFERWGTIQSFQRTRGVLRLLALIVADLYTKQDPSLLIQPSKIDLSNPSIRSEFIKHIGNAYEAVVASDITGPASKAQRIDKEMGTEYQRFKVATSLATSIFFYSFSGAEETKGVGLSRIRLSFLQEGIPPAIVGDAIKRIEEELWYLYSENLLYYFSSQANLNRIIIDREEAIKEEDVEEALHKVLEKLAGKEFDVFIWPKTSQDIPDNSKLKLLILSSQYPYKTASTESFINELLTKYSSGFRTYKNTLIFVLVDSHEFEPLRKVIIRLLALKSIKEDRNIIRSLSEENRHSLDDKLKKAESTIPFRLFSSYRHIAKGSSEGIRFFDLGIPTIGETYNISKRVKEYLKEQELLLGKMSPAYLFSKTFAEKDESKNLGDIKEAFLKFPNLPMIESEVVIKEAIAKGVKDGILGVKVGDTPYFKEPIFEEVLTDESLILRKEIAEREKTKVTVVPGEEGAGAPRVEEEVVVEPEEGIKPTKAVKKIRIRAKIPWDKLSLIPSGIIGPLQRDGAHVQLELEINAESEKGINKDTLQLKIKETLNQIRAEIIDWEET